VKMVAVRRRRRCVDCGIACGWARAGHGKSCARGAHELVGPPLFVLSVLTSPSLPLTKQRVLAPKCEEDAGPAAWGRRSGPEQRCCVNTIPLFGVGSAKRQPFSKNTPLCLSRKTRVYNLNLIMRGRHSQNIRASFAPRYLPTTPLFRPGGWTRAPGIMANFSYFRFLPGSCANLGTLRETANPETTRRPARVSGTVVRW